MNALEHQSQLKNLSSIQDILYNNNNNNNNNDKQQIPYTEPSSSAISYTPSVQYSPKPIPKQIGGYRFPKDDTKEEQELFDNNVDEDDNHDEVMKQAKQFMSKNVRSFFINFTYYNRRYRVN